MANATFDYIRLIRKTNMVDMGKRGKACGVYIFNKLFLEVK
jgi:hypothetical protein